MNFWIARDEIGIGLFEIEPYLREDGYWDSDGKWYEIDEKLFPEVTFENSPQEVEIKIIEK